jgi:hypothetical protein
VARPSQTLFTGTAAWSIHIFFDLLLSSRPLNRTRHSLAEPNLLDFLLFSKLSLYLPAANPQPLDRCLRRNRSIGMPPKRKKRKKKPLLRLLPSAAACQSSELEPWPARPWPGPFIAEAVAARGWGDGGEWGTREMRVRSGPDPVGAALSSDLDARAARVGRCPRRPRTRCRFPRRGRLPRGFPRDPGARWAPRERSDGPGRVSWAPAPRKIGKKKVLVLLPNFAFSSRPGRCARRWSEAVKQAACDRSRSDVYSACFLVVDWWRRSDGDCL